MYFLSSCEKRFHSMYKGSNEKKVYHLVRSRVKECDDLGDVGSTIWLDDHRQCRMNSLVEEQKFKCLILVNKAKSFEWSTFFNRATEHALSTSIGNPFTALQWKISQFHRKYHISFVALQEDGGHSSLRRFNDSLGCPSSCRAVFRFEANRKERREKPTDKKKHKKLRGSLVSPLAYSIALTL